MFEKLKDKRIEIKLFISVLIITLSAMIHTCYQFSAELFLLPNDGYEGEKHAFMVNLYQHYGVIIVVFTSALLLLIWYGKRIF